MLNKQTFKNTESTYYLILGSSPDIVKISQNFADTSPAQLARPVRVPVSYVGRADSSIISAS